MAEVELNLNGAVFRVSSLALCQVCTKFPTNLFPPEYSVRSHVSTPIFELFLSALQGELIEVTKTNVKEFSILCEEFGFEVESSSFRFAQLEATIEELKNDIRHLSEEICSLRFLPSITTKLSETTSELRSNLFSLRHFTQPIGSTIISNFPDVFTEFVGKKFSLLWRGSRDGFKAEEFHRRCNGHANTLTVISDTKGNIFGGFTPLEWEWRFCYKADDSLKSFVFTVKNPHNVPARSFALKAEQKHRTICCSSFCGPDFVDIYVFSDCNTNTDSCTSLGLSYLNDTGIDSEMFFTGEKHFQVQEIEVFEIRD
jgi:hypothetical protein